MTNLTRKERHELGYWRRRKSVEEHLANAHYQQFYTTHFGLDPGFYAGKRLLDIGCGPRGSLEWADMALERVGLDPLTPEYHKLGIDRYKMTYTAAYSESIPYHDHYFDVVTSFNSLDHVADLQGTIEEITRVSKPGGLFLLLTDVGHNATVCEPQEFSWDIVKTFMPHFDVLDERHYEKKAGGIYESILEDQRYDHADPSKRYGILSVNFCRKRP